MSLTTLSSDEREALAYIRRREGRPWKHTLRTARANGRIHTLARDAAMASVLQRFLNHPHNLDAVSGADLDGEDRAALPPGPPEEAPPQIPIPLSPALAYYQAGLAHVSPLERRVFDARLGLRRPLPLRVLAEELHSSVQGIHRIEEAIRKDLAERGLDVPEPVYADLADFRRGLTTREAMIFDGRFATSPPESFGVLAGKLGVKRQRVKQIADDLEVEMARGRLFVGAK